MPLSDSAVPGKAVAGGKTAGNEMKEQRLARDVKLTWRLMYLSPSTVTEHRNESASDCLGASHECRRTGRGPRSKGPGAGVSTGGGSCGCGDRKGRQCADDDLGTGAKRHG